MRIYFILPLFIISLSTFALEEQASETTTTEAASETTTVPDEETSSTSTPEEIPEVVTKTLKRLIRKEAGEMAIAPAPIAGLYEVVLGEAEVTYITADGRYLIMGDIRDTKTGDNLTDSKRNELRRQVINSIDDKDTVVFAPDKETKYTINVFTDVDCPYCAKFHNEVAELNEAGVKVRYFAFPRAGEGSKTYKTMVSVWCSDDRQKAITDAKARREIEEKTCNNPVNDQYELGKRIGVTGTPAMVLSNGDLIPGYVPAKRLVRFLEQKSIPFFKNKNIRP